MQQNISFAKKMIELSEKFDELDRKQDMGMVLAVKRVYQMLPGKHQEASLEGMLVSIS